MIPELAKQLCLSKNVRIGGDGGEKKVESKRRKENNSRTSEATRELDFLGLEG